MKTKNILLLLFLLLAAIVLSGLVSRLTKDIDFLQWLTWGDSVGFDNVNLDLSVVNIGFSFKMQVNVLQIVFIGVALFVYRKVR